MLLDKESVFGSSVDVTVRTNPTAVLFLSDDGLVDEWTSSERHKRSNYPLIKKVKHKFITEPNLASDPFIIQTGFIEGIEMREKMYPI